MSDTPETDAAVMSFAQVSVNLPDPDFELVTAEFARQLERERDEARAILKYWQEIREANNPNQEPGGSS